MDGKGKSSVVGTVAALLVLAIGVGTAQAQEARSIPPREWYFSGTVNRNYEGLAGDSLKDFRASDLQFGEARSDSETSFGIGGIFPVNDWIGLDVGLSTGTGSSTARSFDANGGNSVASVTTDYRLYMADAGARLYVIRRPRFWHWIYLGGLSALARPSGGSLNVAGSNVELSSEQFRSTTTIEPVVGVGTAFPISSRIAPAVIVRHSPRRGWNAGLLLVIPIPQR